VNVSTPQAFNSIQTIGRFTVFFYLLGLIPTYFLQLVHNDFDFVKTTFTEWSSVRVWLLWPVTWIVRPLIAHQLSNSKGQLKPCSGFQKWVLENAFPTAGKQYCEVKKKMIEARGRLKDKNTTAKETFSAARVVYCKNDEKNGKNTWAPDAESFISEPLPLRVTGQKKEEADPKMTASLLADPLLV